MTIQNGNIAHLASKVMDDVPEGGGGPSSAVIPWGQSNGIFDDITEVDRAGGDVSIRQLFSVVRTTGVERFLDANIIVSHPPTDPNVSITLAACSMFAKRSEIAQAIANYLIAGSEWHGYLLENHVAGQRSIDICHRVGTAPPTDNRTLLLIHDEGKGTETSQYVRVVSTETTTRTYSYSTGGGYADYQVAVTECKLQDPLTQAFKGSPPSRSFTRAADGTAIRDTRVADASVYYGSSTLTAVASVGSNVLRVSSIYTQIVPNSRTEAAALDQRPAAQRVLTLATSPRQVDVAVTPHSQRIRVTQENRSYTWTRMLRPLPAPGTIVISYMALGNWYTIIEDANTVTGDGDGTLAGAGVGTVKYMTGSLAFTLPELPDAGSSIIINWGEKSAYTNRSGQAGYRAPEFAWAMPHQCIKPGSVVVTWMSGGVLKTATDNGSGAFTGHAAGEIDYASGKIYLRPTAMIDAGGEFQTVYEYASTRTENFTAPTVDAGGFGSLTLAEVPAANSITVRWITVRNVSASSGTSEIVSSSGNGTVPPVTVDVGAPQAPGNVLTASKTYTMPSDSISFELRAAAPQTAGTYTWRVEATTMMGAEVDDTLVLGSTATGTFSVTPLQVSMPDGSPGMTNDPDGALIGTFSLSVAAGCPDLRFTVFVSNQVLTRIAVSQSIVVDAVGSQLTPAWPTTPPPPVITTREPVVMAGTTTAGISQPLPYMAHAGWNADTGSRVFVRVPRIPLTAGSIYADADGMGYDLPNVHSVTSGGDSSVRWTPSDFAAGFKSITSVAGVDTKYYLWK